MLMRRDSFRLPPVTLLTLIVEIAIILGAAFWATRSSQDMSPRLQWSGTDLPLVTQGTAFASQVFQKTGKIPLWNPFIGNGEPVMEGTESFVLNPFMAAPYLLLGPIVGSKVGILLHIVIMGLGGWTLARTLGLRWAGRIMLGVFLIGSGSVAAPMGRGLYQLALSQTYMPWIFAGLIGTLYSKRRWCLGLFVVATMLMVFAGTFWYIMPTAISCALISLFALLRFRLEISRQVARQLLTAAIFIGGLCLLRLLPVNRTLLYHATASEPTQTTFLVKLSTYFLPMTLNPPSNDWWMNYHYVLPAFFATLIVLALVVLLLAGFRREAWGPPLWRIVAPAILIICVFTLWGQGETDLKHWVYEQLPFLEDWRNVGRIAAAASIWIVILAAIGFDTIISFLTQAYRRGAAAVNGTLLPRKIRLFSLASRPLIALFLVACGVAAVNVLSNWAQFDHLVDLTEQHLRQEDFHGEVEGLTFLRAQFPNAMLLVQTQSYVAHFGFVETLTRDIYGDADVFTVGLPSTIGGSGVMRFAGDFAVGTNGGFVQGLKDSGYVPVNGSPIVYDNAIAWENPAIPPYAFWVPRSRLVDSRDIVLTSAETQPVTYAHHIDSVDVTLNDYAADSVLVVNETDYPGWTVNINGRPATVESVYGRLGVVLPDPHPANEFTEVTFSYQPVSLRTGAVIFVLMSILLAGYLLRLDQRIGLVALLYRLANNRRTKRAIAVFTTPGVFEEYNSGEDSVPLLKPPTQISITREDQDGDSADQSRASRD